MTNGHDSTRPRLPSQAKGEHDWAVVLAAGDGTRLRSLTRLGGGVVVPKQFCSLQGESSLLRQAVRRAERSVARERILVVVAEAHRRWWQQELADLPSENILVQPANRGTAAGVLFPLVELLRRDPAANLLVVPSDHFVADEGVLALAAARALERLETKGRIVLLGIAPDRPSTGFGWIVPTRTVDGSFRGVARFVEKPELEDARRLLRDGAVWNSFLFASSAERLLWRFAVHLPELTASMCTALDLDRSSGALRPQALASMYRTLAPLDFSREILQRDPGELEVLMVPPCGWNDLGTPERVGACLLLVGSTAQPAPVDKPSAAPLDLSLAYGKLVAPFTRAATAL